MSDEEYDYFGWAKTGHLNLSLGLFFGIFCLFALAVSVDMRETGAIVLYAFLLLSSVIGFMRGVRELRAHRAKRQE